MEIENKTNIFSENRGTVIFVIILAVIIVILLGVLFFVKQKNLGEGITPRAMKENSLQNKKTLAQIIELTSAPEKNPDIKPNPTLTALSSAPESSIHAQADIGLVDKLTAPKN